MTPSPRSDSNSRAPIVRASEISQYAFCHRAWWLGTVQGYRPVNEALLESGTQAHHRHGLAVAASQRWQRVGYALLAIGILLGAVALCGVLGGNL
jgi:hypothetical protein